MTWFLVRVTPLSRCHSQRNSTLPNAICVTHVDRKQKNRDVCFTAGNSFVRLICIAIRQALQTSPLLVVSMSESIFEKVAFSLAVLFKSEGEMKKKQRKKGPHTHTNVEGKAKPFVRPLTKNVISFAFMSLANTKRSNSSSLGFTFLFNSLFDIQRSHLPDRTNRLDLGCQHDHSPGALIRDTEN